MTAAIGAALGQRGYFRNLKADAPAGSRFKDYASFVVQDLAVRPHVTDFLRECWRTPHIFADRTAWSAHLDLLGASALKVHPDPVLIATEAAALGSVKAHGFLANAVIVSDHAG